MKAQETADCGICRERKGEIWKNSSNQVHLCGKTLLTNNPLTDHQPGSYQDHLTHYDLDTK